ncbi:MOB kinase activator 2-like isoform X1 [Myxocyprinus asiaticus]|uniref:MOB kinase activator 2-like isoform X1 n=1 Tax=Myxocyprinus asiaticus TaxID=70543 RepID=UPI0022235B5B|nr:MOB kinase activator 2-like isoform X1 [Myxocyprinus asiaticus]
MGGCQSYSSSDEEDVNTLKANHNNISLFKIKNNSLHMIVSAEVKPYLQDHILSRHITDVDLLTLSAHPHGLDQQEWIATNTDDLVAQLHNRKMAKSGCKWQMHFMESCDIRGAPSLYEWTDEQGKKLKCSAPLYIDYAMSYIQELLADERVFPTRAYSSFPPGFMFLIQKVFVMLFRTLAHLFSAHYQDAIVVELHPHLNTLFTHFITFSHTFRLLDPAETAPIDDLIARLTH